MFKRYLNIVNLLNLILLKDSWCECYVWETEPFGSKTQPLGNLAQQIKRLDRLQKGN